MYSWERYRSSDLENIKNIPNKRNITNKSNSESNRRGTLISSSIIMNEITFILDSQTQNQLKNRKKSILYTDPKYNIIQLEPPNEDSFSIVILKHLPNNFKITTNNSSAQLNIDILEKTSSVITKFHKENPNAIEYHIDIDDNDNILQKYEQLYQGERVVFTEEEKSITLKINEFLGLPKSFYYTNNTEENKYNIINKGSLFRYFNKAYKYKKFTIITNNDQYLIEYMALFTSKTLSEIVKKDQTITEYKYDFNDENNEFQPICDLLNFQKIEITLNNMYSLKEIGEDLKIESILPPIEKFINDYEELSKTIDDQQNLTDSIEELFNWLYNINTLSVSTVQSSILNSKWIKTEDDVIELAAFILQVIKTSIKLHPYLIDLIIQLNENSNENKLNILIPYISKHLMFSFGSSLSNCSFIYKLYQKGIISKKDLFLKLSKFNLNNIKYVLYWFLSEIVELKIEIIKNNKFDNNFFEFYYPNKIDLYNKMRDKGEPDDELTNSIRNDDVDKLQSILTKSNKDFTKYSIPFNIFDDFIDNNEKMSLIDYAAANGSVKCFKYLLLNHLPIDETTFNYSIFGGNTEIIKIIYQQQQQQQILQIKKQETTNEYYINDISIAIGTHRNDLFDWILENKYSNQINEVANSILLCSVLNGNSYSFISIIDKCSISIKYIQLFTFAAKNGFYKLTCLIFNIMNKKEPDYMSKISANNMTGFRSLDRNFGDSISRFAFFGNLSIFKLIIKYIKDADLLSNALIISIQNDNVNIFNFIMDEFIQNDHSFLTQILFLNAANAASTDNKPIYYFNHLIEIIKNIEPRFLIDSSILVLACQVNNIENIKIIMKLAKEKCKKMNITSAFNCAACNGFNEICEYMINDKDFAIDFKRILINAVKQNDHLIGSFNKEIFSLIFEKLTPELKELYLSFSLNAAINNKNKDLIELLLNKNVDLNDSLLHAVKSNDIDIVNMILNYNSTPSFINKNSLNGTALCISVKNNNIEIVKRLLSIPGIDLNLSDRKHQTPLVLSVCNLNVDIMNEILDFYGDKIQTQLWQINKSIKILLIKLEKKSKNDDDDNNNNNDDDDDYEDEIIDEYSDKDKLKVKCIPILKRILKIKNINPNVYYKNNTLLYYACKFNEIEIVKILLELDSIDVNSYSKKNNNTPLLIALLNKNIEIVELLIQDKRTNINSKNDDNETALIIATKLDLENIVSLLIKDERFNPDESCLNYAFLISSDITISNLLLSTNLIDINYKNLSLCKHLLSYECNGILYETPLIKAVDSNDIEKVNLIVNHPSFDKIKSQLKSSILISISKNNVDIFNILLSLIDNDVNIKIGYKTTPLLAAVTQSSGSIFNEIIKNKNFDPDKNDMLEIFNTLLLKNLSNIVKLEHIFDMAEQIYEIDSKHSRLIDLNKTIENDENYLNYFIKRSSKDTVDFLMKHDIDPNICDTNEIYPLECAIILSKKGIISTLLDSNKVDLNKKIPYKNQYDFIKKFGKNNDNNNNNNIGPDYKEKPKYTTYLHLAIKLGNVDIFNLLLQNKSININIEDELGNTPLMEAYLFKNKTFIES